MVEKRLRAVGSLQHAGDDGAADPRLPRARQLQDARTTRRRRSPTRHQLDGPPKEFIYDRLAHPPAIFRQEKLKSDVRLPAARRFIVENKLNEIFDGDQKRRRHHRAGRPLQRPDLRAAARSASPTQFGASRDPDPRAQRGLSAGARGDQRVLPRQAAVLVLEEGQPEFIEQEIATLLRRADVPTKLHGKDGMHMAGEYNVEIAGARPQQVPGAACAAARISLPALPGWMPFEEPRKRRPSCSARCRCARRRSASAVRSGRCSRR